MAFQKLNDSLGHFSCLLLRRVLSICRDRKSFSPGKRLAHFPGRKRQSRPRRRWICKANKSTNSKESICWICGEEEPETEARSLLQSAGSPLLLLWVCVKFWSRQAAIKLVGLMPNRSYFLLLFVRAHPLEKSHSLAEVKNDACRCCRTNTGKWAKKRGQSVLEKAAALTTAPLLYISIKITSTPKTLRVTTRILRAGLIMLFCVRIISQQSTPRVYLIRPGLPKLQPKELFYCRRAGRAQTITST